MIDEAETGIHTRVQSGQNPNFTTTNISEIELKQEYNPSFIQNYSFVD
jgi:hypothetical protein